MCQFIETIRLKNGTLQDLKLHQQRVEKTFAKFFPNKKPHDLEAFSLKKRLPQGKQTHKFRIVYNEKEIGYSCEEYRLKNPKLFFLVEDKSIDYSYKFHERNCFEKHRKDAKSDIIITRNGYLTDASYANLIFYDGKDWFTPKTYLLNGVQRKKMLNEKAIIEKEIHRNDLENYSYFKRINAMLPFDESPLFSSDLIRF